MTPENNFNLNTAQEKAKSLIHKLLNGAYPTKIEENIIISIIRNRDPLLMLEFCIHLLSKYEGRMS